MIYGSSKDRFKRVLDGIQIKLQATDPCHLNTNRRPCHREFLPSALLYISELFIVCEMVNFVNHGINFQVLPWSLLFVLDKCLPPTTSMAGLVLCKQAYLWFLVYHVICYQHNLCTVEWPFIVLITTKLICNCLWGVRRHL